MSTEQKAHHNPDRRSGCTTRRSISTASCPGSTSTSACCNWPRTSEVPLLERVKFCAIYTTNLDEYYMVRVAGLHDQIDAGVENPGPDGRIPSETIALIRERVLELGGRLTDCFEGRLRPALAEHDIRVVAVNELDDEQRAELARHFQKVIFPALTPLAVAPGRPVSLHLQPVSEPGRARARSRHRPDGVRAREGADRDPAALRHAEGVGAGIVPGRSRCWRWRT